MSGSYSLGDGATEVNGLNGKVLNNDQYAALLSAAADGGFDMSQVNLAQSNNLEALHDGYAGLDIEFTYIADQGEVALGNDFDLNGKISDFAAAITDKFMLSTFLEPLVKSIMEDSKKATAKLKETRKQ
jgi:hypothetical protein